jgi:radical SAM-linked protein
LKSQRLRFRYRVTTDAGDLSNRDLVQAWEAALTKAGYAVAYSEGRRASVQVAIAAPLPFGVTSEGELADVYLEIPANPGAVLAGIARHLPAGVDPLCVTEVGVDAPSLQSQLRWAEYEVTLQETVAEDLERRLEELLDARTLPSEYVRTNRTKTYDLRPLVLGLTVAETPDGLLLCMRLRAEQDRTARADQVLLALGIQEGTVIRRTHLGLEEVGGALLAHRRAGEPEGADSA